MIDSFIFIYVNNFRLAQQSTYQWFSKLVVHMIAEYAVN